MELHCNEGPSQKRYARDARGNMGIRGNEDVICFTPNTHNCVKVDEKRISKQQRKLEQQVNGPPGLLWVLKFGTEYDGV